MLLPEDTRRSARKPAAAAVMSTTPISPIPLAPHGVDGGSSSLQPGHLDATDLGVGRDVVLGEVVMGDLAQVGVEVALIARCISASSGRSCVLPHGVRPLSPGLYQRYQRDLPEPDLPRNRNPSSHRTSAATAIHHRM